MDKLSDITEVLDPLPAKRGRKPGSPRVPGSGRQPGTKNKVVADVREMILARGKPIELLCDISRGVKIRVGPQAGPGDPQYAYPTLQERAAAAKVLLDKLVPAAPASAPAPDDGPNEPEREMSPIDVARRMIFTVNRARRELGLPSLSRDAKVLTLEAEDVAPGAAPAPVDKFAHLREAQAAEIAALRAAAATTKPDDGDYKGGGYADAAAVQRAENAQAIKEGRLARPVPVWVDENRRPRPGEDYTPTSTNVTRFRPRHR